MIVAINSKEYIVTVMPIIVHLEEERSVTIAKFYIGEKEYIVRATKDGGLILN